MIKLQYTENGRTWFSPIAFHEDDDAMAYIESIWECFPNREVKMITN